MTNVGFGGGCHWCTEAVFQSLKGVTEVRQGFICSDAPHHSYSEAVEITFDPIEIPLDVLIKVHVATHASASAHKMRGKYRSAIYATDEDTLTTASEILRDLSAETGMEFVTQVLVHRGFKPSDARFHNYYSSDPARPFCTTYIDPKLAKIRSQFAQYQKGHTLSQRT